MQPNTMSSPARAKTADRQEISRKLVNLLRKHYKSPPAAKKERPVLETLLYAVCLEDASPEQAEAAFARLYASFHDLNEIRVSSISELASVFEGMENPEWRAARVRAILQHVFEKHFEFAFEAIRRKTLELATKQLTRIRDLSPFVRNFVLNTALGSHTIPVDQRMTNAAIWMGLIPATETPQQAAELLKNIVRKPDAPLFCQLLRSIAVDPRLSRAFDFSKYPVPEGGFDLSTSPERLEKLFRSGPGPVKPPPKPKPVPKAVPKAAADKKPRDRKTSRNESRATARGSSVKATVRKPARKTTPSRKKNNRARRKLLDSQKCSGPRTGASETDRAEFIFRSTGPRISTDDGPRCLSAGVENPIGISPAR
jgi:endonuclease-3